MRYSRCWLIARNCTVKNVVQLRQASNDGPSANEPVVRFGQAMLCPNDKDFLLTTKINNYGKSWKKDPVGLCGGEYSGA